MFVSSNVLVLLIVVCCSIQDGFSISISKRATVSSFTTQQFNDEMLARHNTLRKQEAIANKAQYMYIMQYSDTIAAGAQSWANACDFVHSKSGYGENLYYTTGGSTEIASVVDSWYNEHNYYNFADNSCSKVCGHYQQVVWAMSKDLGCGIKFCETLKDSEENKEYKNAYYVVCRYDAGRQAGQPYVKGTQACEKCPNNCVDSALCEYSYTIQECKNEYSNCDSLATNHKDAVCVKGGAYYDSIGQKCRKACGLC